MVKLAFNAIRRVLFPTLSAFSIISHANRRGAISLISIFKQKPSSKYLLTLIQLFPFNILGGGAIYVPGPTIGDRDREVKKRPPISKSLSDCNCNIL